MTRSKPNRTTAPAPIDSSGGKPKPPGTVPSAMPTLRSSPRKQENLDAGPGAGHGQRTGHALQGNLGSLDLERVCGTDRQQEDR